MAGDLSDGVRRLLSAHIDSLEQLEILLLLHRDRNRRWTANDVAAELRTASESASERLVDLERRGFAKHTAAAYQFDASPDLDRAVAELATTYPVRRVSIINFIFSKPTDKMKSFADAFRLRKGDTNG